MSFSFKARLTGLCAALLVAMTVAFAVPSQAQQRFVVINGELLSPQQLYVLDQLVGGHVPNGSYWVDTNSGIWGYAGDPTPRGRIGAGGGSGGGMDYSGTLDHGPFGTYMSDGECSFVNGVPVGNC